jgi:predicted membrane channel-forming protein YqfA (hemolysin III family)
VANTHTFSKGEEIANSITHGIGIFLSIAALVLLIVFSALHGTAWHIVSFTIFGSTMIIMYTSSTLLHAFPEGSRMKDLFEIFTTLLYIFLSLERIHLICLSSLKVGLAGRFLGLYGEWQSEERFLNPSSSKNTCSLQPHYTF